MIIKRRRTKRPVVESTRRRRYDHVVLIKERISTIVETSRSGVNKRKRITIVRLRLRANGRIRRILGSCRESSCCTLARLGLERWRSSILFNHRGVMKGMIVKVLVVDSQFEDLTFGHTQMRHPDRSIAFECRFETGIAKEQVISIKRNRTHKYYLGPMRLVQWIDGRLKQSRPGNARRNGGGMPISRRSKT